jgi:hypothetical protein
MGGVGETGAVVSVGASGAGAAAAGDVPTASPRENSSGSRHLINRACIERLLSVFNGNAPCVTGRTAHVLRAIYRRVNIFIR